MGQREASLPVPAAWLETTVRAALKTVHYTTAVGAISASVAALTEGTLKLMFRTKLKSIVGAVAVNRCARRWNGLARAWEAGARRCNRGPASPQRRHLPCRERTTVTKGERTGRGDRCPAFNLARTGEDDGLSGTVAVDPKTGKWRSIFKGISLGPGPVSPDGRYIVYSSFARAPDDQVGIWIYDMNGEMAPRRIFERKGEPHWTNNGQAVVIATPSVRRGRGWRPGA